MEKRKSIVGELQEIGSSLAEYPGQTPYQPVPGYFEQFPATMLNLVREDEIVPALTELRSPFSVPEGYFDGLAGSVLEKLKKSGDEGSALELSQTAEEELSALSPMMAGLSKAMPFSVPDNYFDVLAARIGELDERLSPLMHDLKKVNVFTVPDGYFNTLPSLILAGTKPEPAKVVKGNFGNRILRYATAALIAGAMITGGFFLLNRDQAGQQIVSVKGLEEKTAQTSDEDILRYLENQPVASFDVQPMSEDEIKDDAILDMLADVSDEELQQYVQYQSEEKQLFN